MRVAVFAECYLPYLSGVTVSVEALTRGLVEAGDEVMLVAPEAGRRDQPVSATPGPMGTRVCWLPSFQLPAAPRGYRVPWPVAPRQMETVRAFAPEIVHANSPFISGIMARSVARAARAALVFTHHTRFQDYSHYLGGLSRPGAWVTRAYLGSYWRGCAAVIAPGRQLADEIQEELGAGSRPLVRVIPTGVDVAGIAALSVVDPRGLAGWPSDSVVVASLGRLAPEKSVNVLVEAMARLAERAPQVRLLVIGGGPSETDIRASLAADGLADTVRLTGRLPHDDALALLRGADLFAFASRTETQGLVLAEALAAGVPVVALDAPGVRDSVRDGIDGTVVEDSGSADDEVRADALASAMDDLVRDGERRRAMARRAAEGAARFDLGRRIGEVRDLYGDLLTGVT